MTDLALNSKNFEWSVGKLIKLKDKSLLTVNLEYQRGPTWDKQQQQKLIDSILRGYPLPKFYVHLIEEVDEELDLNNKRWEIVDGQQRLNAIDMYMRGDFRLLDPKDPKSKFPLFLRELDSPWANLGFSQLEPQHQDVIRSFELSIVEIQTNDADKIRDLFVRLQSGSDLLDQERRDAYPGNFNGFIYSLGGKKGLEGAHPLFEAPGIRGIRPQSPKSREFAAQLAMTIINMDERGGFSDVGSRVLDEF